MLKYQEQEKQFSEELQKQSTSHSEQSPVDKLPNNINSLKGVFKYYDIEHLARISKAAEQVRAKKEAEEENERQARVRNVAIRKLISDAVFDAHFKYNIGPRRIAQILNVKISTIKKILGI